MAMPIEKITLIFLLIIVPVCGLAAQFNACDIAQPHGGAVWAGAQHDVAKLLHAADDLAPPRWR